MTPPGSSTPRPNLCISSHARYIHTRKKQERGGVHMKITSTGYRIYPLLDTRIVFFSRGGHLDTRFHLYIFREFPPTRKSVLIGANARVPLHHDRYDGSRLFQKMSWGFTFFFFLLLASFLFWDELDLALVYIQTVLK